MSKIGSGGNALSIIILDAWDSSAIGLVSSLSPRHTEQLNTPDPLVCYSNLKQLRIRLTITDQNLTQKQCLPYVID